MIHKRIIKGTLGGSGDNGSKAVNGEESADFEDEVGVRGVECGRIVPNVDSNVPVISDLLRQVKLID